MTLEHPSSQFPRGYVVQVSTDGQGWQEVARDSDNWGEVEVEFEPVTARYVLVETTKSSDYYPWGIAEFIVWRSSPTWLRGQEAEESGSTRTEALPRREPGVRQPKDRTLRRI